MYIHIPTSIRVLILKHLQPQDDMAWPTNTFGNCEV